MKKSLLALAVFGAFAGTASAQTAAPSSVTLYGIADVGLLYTSPKNSTNSGAAGFKDTFSLSSGNQSGSRFGLRGSEDLGNGLRAVFVLENGFNIDTGTAAQGGRLFGRIAYAGLVKSDLGEIRLGRQKGATYDLFDQIDVFGTAFNDAGLQATFSSIQTAGANPLARIDNEIQFRSANYNGFVGFVGYSFNTGTALNVLSTGAATPAAGTAGGAATGTELPTVSANVNSIQAGGIYANGPLVVAATFEDFNCPNGLAVGTVASATCRASNASGTVNAQSHDQRHYNLGATFDFKIVKVHAAFAREENQFLGSTIPAVGTSTPNRSDSYAVGATVPLAGGNVLFQAQRRRDTTDNRPKANELNVEVYAIGYTYPLSRRTNLWTYFSDRNGHDALENNQTFDRYQAGFGIRHTF